MSVVSNTDSVLSLTEHIETSKSRSTSKDVTETSKKSTSTEAETDNDLEANALSGILSFDYSFGYDCKQYFNLTTIDERFVIYYSGTIIHIFNTNTLEFEFRQSLSKSGIGHIVKNPHKNHLAIGEKCVKPLIIVYEWPTFNVLSKMKEGTTFGYAHLGYSPDGTMLVSQGKDPDYTITIWDWEQAHIILRVKSHGQDVFNAEFSQFVPGQLTTSGLGHIKFWKMAKTFTGLKLQGELGRFGKTEICDILGICAMPDEKVISTSEWGNLLVWEDRLIKLEVRQKARDSCHSSAISQILYNPETQDIISVGMDGWVKLWTRATIDAADPPDEDDWKLEMQPLLEVRVLDKFSAANLMCIVGKNSDPDNKDWFGQDGDGGIWEISLDEGGGTFKRLMTCHAGSVAGMAASPLGHYVASLGSNGCLLIHDVNSRQLILSKRFPVAGTSLLWMPLHVEVSGSVLVGGFSDGVLRVFVVSIKGRKRSLIQNKKTSAFNEAQEYINIIQRVKSHNASITDVSLNPRGSILVSGGADNIIFVHQIVPKHEFVQLQPIGYVELSASITFITWRPKLNSTVVVGCRNGSVTEVNLPERALSYTSATYCLSLERKVLTFKSVKSEILRANEIAEIERKKLIKLERKQAELEKIKSNNPNLDIDEDLYLMDSDEELEFPPLFYPEVPSPVLFVMFLPNENLYLSMGNFDCGYFYHYTFDSLKPIRSDPLPKALDIPVHCFLPILDGKLIALGMANGVVRVVRCEDGIPDLTNYWELPMHDPDHGILCKLSVSYDNKYLYSCGTDGNIFTYLLNADIISPKPSLGTFMEKPKKSLDLMSDLIPREVVMDQSGEEELSLEQTKQAAERINHEKIAQKQMEAIRYKLTQLREIFQDILHRNKILPESQVLPLSEFELDTRITEALCDKIKSEQELMMKKIAFKVLKSHLLVKKMQNHFVDRIASLDVTVRAIKNEDLRIKAFTHNKLEPEFLAVEKDMRSKLKVISSKSTLTRGYESRGTGSIVTITRPSGLESFMKIKVFYHKLPLKGKKAFVKRNMMKTKKDRRERQWQEFLDLKPNIHVDDPMDIIAFEKATQTIGDFKLKSAEDYKVPEAKRISPAQKLWQILNLHREIYESKEDFNKKVCNVRNSKIWLVRRFKQLYNDLDSIQKELHPNVWKERLPIPTCYLRNNFPEHIFRLEFGADPTIYHPVSEPYNEDYLVLHLDTNYKIDSSTEAVLLKWKDNSKFEDLQQLAYDDNQDTPWECELKAVRMVHKLHAQDKIIKEMVEGVDMFDDNLENLSIDRLKFARNIKMMEIFMLTLHQELIVINSYAGQEDHINKKINSSIQHRNEKLNHKISMQDSIDASIQDMTLWQLKLSEMQEDIANKLINNKFASFLNRIYKKKRAIRRSSQESSSESSSSDDVSEDDMDEDENEDYIPIKLDENVCPEGCDPELYKEIIDSRNVRYDIEDCVSELRKRLEELNRDLTVCTKELLKLESDVQAAAKESEDLQFEKQQKLNDIETIVVLNLSQFCHFVKATHPEDGLVQNPLAFHNEVLFTLAGRVRELDKETEEEHLKLSKQKMLMQRLNKKKKELKEIRKTLLKDIDDEVLKKFGQIIDVEDMEESVLKKMLSRARRDYHVDLLREKYDKIIADMKKQLWIHRDSLMGIEEENTRRVKFQIMLEQESMRLEQHIKQQKLKMGKVISKTDEEEFDRDLKGLESILEDQQLINAQIKEKICNLKYKCKPLQPKVVEDIDTSIQGPKTSQEEDKTVKETGTLEEIPIVEITETTLETIDGALCRLASGSSAYEVAVYIVDELLNLPRGQKTSGLECAMKLVEELVQITVGAEDMGDILLVEEYAEQLMRLSKTSSNLDVIQEESEVD